MAVERTRRGLAADLENLRGETHAPLQMHRLTLMAHQDCFNSVISLYVPMFVFRHLTRKNSACVWAARAVKT